MHAICIIVTFITVHSVVMVYDGVYECQVGLSLKIAYKVLNTCHGLKSNPSF